MERKVVAGLVIGALILVSVAFLGFSFIDDDSGSPAGGRTGGDAINSDPVSNNLEHGYGSEAGSDVSIRSTDSSVGYNNI